MTMLEMGKTIGELALLRVEGFQVQVHINDAKQAYGNTRYLVTPTNGTGGAWVDSSRLTNIGQGV
jgi:hypothetical protein